MKHTKFMNYILPRKTSELTFTEVVKLLKEIFRLKTSLFHKRLKCMNLTKKDSEDYTTFASVVNEHCDDFKLSELSANNFKCLIFVKGFNSTKRGCPHGVMVKVMDSGIVVSEFVLQSRYYVHFRANTLGKGMNSLILPAMG